MKMSTFEDVDVQKKKLLNIQFVLVKWPILVFWRTSALFGSSHFHRGGGRGSSIIKINHILGNSIATDSLLKYESNNLLPFTHKYL